MFGRATITLGIGPHSSFPCYSPDSHHSSDDVYWIGKGTYFEVRTAYITFAITLVTW